jgi:hypothetical protein
VTDLEAANRAPPGSRQNPDPRKLLGEEHDNEKNNSSNATLRQDEVDTKNAVLPSSEENESCNNSAINFPNLNSISEDADKPQDKNTDNSVASELQAALEKNTDIIGENEPKRKKADSASTSSADQSQNHIGGSNTAGEVTPVELLGTTIGEKLDSCLNALKKDQHDQIVASGNLSQSHDEMKKFLKAVIKSKGRKGGRSKSHAPIMYICGAPGSGKTMSTIQLCEEAIEDEKNELESWDAPSRYYYLNCSHLQNFSKDDVLNKIMSDLKVRNFDRPHDDAADRAIILILDEVDTLMGSKGTEDALKKLCDWAQDESQRLSLIGISNAVNNPKSMRLFEYGIVSRPICASPMRFGTESQPRDSLYIASFLFFS